MMKLIFWNKYLKQINNDDWINKMDSEVQVKKEAHPQYLRQPL